MDGSGRSDGRGAAPRRKGRLWCPICLCVLTHIPVLEGLMHWLRMFHWCLVRLEKEAGGRKRVSRRPTELDAAVFQLTLEVDVDGQLLTDGSAVFYFSFGLAIFLACALWFTQIASNSYV